MEIINLDEIMDKVLHEYSEGALPYMRNVIREAMREACEQTIDLCTSTTPGYVAKMDMQKLKKQIQ
jgi:histone H3/H4